MIPEDKADENVRGEQGQALSSQAAVRECTALPFPFGVLWERSLNP